jgi:hypothetical protein
MVPRQLHFPSLLILRIAAGYMVAIGMIGLLGPLLRLGPSYTEFEAQSFAYRIGAHTRALAFAAASIVAGIGLFWHHAWARKLALGLLVVGTFYAATEFAWGFSSGQPTARVRLFSGIGVVMWNGLWFCLIYRLLP